MWDLCIRRLGMSEGETSRRLNAVKLVRRFPSLLGRIERGEIHLSTLKILGRRLGEANVDQLACRWSWSGRTRARSKRAPRPSFQRSAVST